MKLTLQKQEDCFLPFDEESLNYVKRLPENSEYIVNVVRSRNPKYHRLAMKRLRIMYDMVDEDKTFDPWRRLLTVKAGYFDALSNVKVNGEVQVALVPHSLSFEKMDEDEFRECFKALHQAFIDKYAVKLTYDQLCEWSVM